MNQAGFMKVYTVAVGFTFQKLYQWVSWHIKRFDDGGFTSMDMAELAMETPQLDLIAGTVLFGSLTLLCLREFQYIWFPLSCYNSIRHAPFGSFRQPNSSAEQRWFHTPANNRWGQLWGHRKRHKARWAKLGDPVSDNWIIVIERVCWLQAYKWWYTNLVC